MRLTQAYLDELITLCSQLTGETFKDSIFGGYHHIYYRQGELLFSGTMRECYNFLQAFKIGLRFEDILKLL